MALRDDLLNYIARHGQDAITIDKPGVVIVGEVHAFLRRNDAAVRTTAMTRLVRELLADQRFRYFGNESFLNAGPTRQAIRDYWVRAMLPPGFDNAAPGAAAMDQQEVGRRVMPHRFQPVLDDLRARPRYVLSIGSRMDGNIRDRRLAQHFFEEVTDRGIARNTPGVLLLGAIHAAAVPFELGHTTTRMILEQHGYPCTSIRIITDFANDNGADDGVLSLASFADDADPAVIRLTSLHLQPRICFSTRASPDSPFFSVRDQSSDSGRSIAEQYEFMVLHRG